MRSSNATNQFKNFAFDIGNESEWIEYLNFAIEIRIENVQKDEWMIESVSTVILPIDKNPENGNRSCGCSNVV